MAQSDSAVSTDRDDGLRIRGPHTHHDGTDVVDDLAGLSLRQRPSESDRIDLVEFGSDVPEDDATVTVRRDEIPKIVEALLERSDPDDLAYLRERTALALEMLGKKKAE